MNDYGPFLEGFEEMGRQERKDLAYKMLVHCELLVRDLATASEYTETIKYGTQDEMLEAELDYWTRVEQLRKEENFSSVDDLKKKAKELSVIEDPEELIEAVLDHVDEVF